MVMLCLASQESLAQGGDPEINPPDEPGIVEILEEPGLSLRVDQQAFASHKLSSRFRLELAFGYSSLLVDPDVKEGIGGGFYFSYAFHPRFGLEFSLFFAKNDYEELLGTIGATFLAGNLSLGPIIFLTPPEQKVMVSLDFGLGTYFILPIFQEHVWTLGVSGGVTLGYRLTTWAGLGIKCRYHLFNFAKLSGPDLLDLKSFIKVGVIDRLEVPGYFAFYF